MKYFNLNICPFDYYGFCNQLYSIVGMSCNCIRNNINLLFLSYYRSEIKTNKFVPIHQIIDLYITNKYLSKYNLALLDYTQLNLKIINAKLGTNIYNIDITKEIQQFIINNQEFVIARTYNLNLLKYNPVIHFKNNFNIDIILNKDIKLYITFLVNNQIEINEEFEVNNGYLNEDININFNKEFNSSLQYNDGSQLFCDILRNITFNDELVKVANNFVSNINNKDINCIHLRLEDDAIESHSKQNNLEFYEYKKQVENKYIEVIKKYIDPNDITIILAHNYQNNVINFLNKNNYNYILTPKFHEDRDISAIIDMHIGMFCNKTYIFMFESSFSFTLLSRIYKKDSNLFCPIMIEFNALNKIEQIIQNKIETI